MRGMDALVLRDLFGDNATLSRYYIDYRDGKGWCYFGAAVEDKDRGLVVGMTAADRKRLFVYGETAISSTDFSPPYLLGLHDSDKHGPDTLHVLDVPGNTWILQHPGVDGSSSLGCICPGLRRDPKRWRLVPGTSGPAVDWLKVRFVPLIKHTKAGGELEGGPCTIAVRRVPGAATWIPRSRTMGRVPDWDCPTATS